jgi:hypothetical protein
VPNSVVEADTAEPANQRHKPIEVGVVAFVRCPPANRALVRGRFAIAGGLPPSAAPPVRAAAVPAGRAWGRVLLLSRMRARSPLSQGRFSRALRRARC